LNDDIGAGAEELALMGDLLESMIVRGRNDAGDIEEINMKKERVRTTVELDGGTSTDDVYRHIERARRTVEQRLGGSLDRAARGS
jgi:hypothetical protein